MENIGGNNESSKQFTEINTELFIFSLQQIVLHVYSQHTSNSGFKFNQRWSKLARRKNYMVERQTIHENRLPEEILAQQRLIPNLYQEQLRYNWSCPGAEELNYRTHRSLPVLWSYDFQVTLLPIMNSTTALGYSQEIAGSSRTQLKYSRTSRKHHIFRDSWC